MMSFDPRAIFANLAEKEKIKGHHSAEGRTIRTLSRALNGWSSGNLSHGDVLVLCDQAMEDWLKSRLKMSAWSTPNFSELLERAVLKEVIPKRDAVKLQRLHDDRSREVEEAGAQGAHLVESQLELCIQIVEKHW
jgi:hypothetical protein